MLNWSTFGSFVGRITGASADYPYGSSRNESAPGAGDGTPHVEARADDIVGLQQALLVAGGLVPSGASDTALASQQLQGIIQQAMGRATLYDDTGVADAYIIEPRTNQQSPGAVFGGMVLRFSPLATNTGASTADVSALLGEVPGTTVLDVKLVGGVTDLVAGQLAAGVERQLVYRSTPQVHLELSPSVAEGAPVGSLLVMDGDVVPDGYLKRNGAALLRATYPRLWAYAQTVSNFTTQATKDADPLGRAGYYGDGDGATTFTIPDARGEFIRGWDDGRGQDAGRSIGSWQDGTYVGNQIEAGSSSGINLIITDSDGTKELTYAHALYTSSFPPTSRTLIRVRPNNIAYMLCIKY